MYFGSAASAFACWSKVDCDIDNCVQPVSVEYVVVENEVALSDPQNVKLPAP